MTKTYQCQLKDENYVSFQKILMFKYYHLTHSIFIHVFVKTMLAHPIPIYLFFTTSLVQNFNIVINHSCIIVKELPHLQNTFTVIHLIFFSFLLW